MLSKMSGGNFNWFLHVMLFMHILYIIQKQEDEGEIIVMMLMMMLKLILRLKNSKDCINTCVVVSPMLTNENISLYLHIHFVIIGNLEFHHIEEICLCICSPLR